MNAEPHVPAPGEPEPADADAPVDAAEVEEEPLNRAARRAHAKQAAPSHVGPRQAFGKPAARGGRPRTKRHQ